MNRTGQEQDQQAILVHAQPMQEEYPIQQQYQFSGYYQGQAPTQLPLPSVIPGPLGEQAISMTQSFTNPNQLAQFSRFPVKVHQAYLNQFSQSKQLHPQGQATQVFQERQAQVNRPQENVNQDPPQPSSSQAADIQLNEKDPETLVRYLNEMSNTDLCLFDSKLMNLVLTNISRFGLATLIRGNYFGNVEGLAADHSVIVAESVMSFVQRMLALYETGWYKNFDVSVVICKNACAFVQFAHLMDVVILRSIFHSDPAPFSPETARTKAEIAAIGRIVTSLKMLTKSRIMEAGGQTLFALFPQMLTGMTDTLNLVASQWDLMHDPSGIAIITEGFRWLLTMSYNYSVKRHMIPHPRMTSGRFFDVVSTIINILTPIALNTAGGNSIRINSYQKAACRALDHVFLVIVNLIGDDRIDPNAPAFLDSIIAPSPIVIEKLGNVLSNTINFIEKALNERKWALTPLSSGFKVLELFADDSNFKATAAKLSTAKIFAPIFSLSKFEINAMYDDVCNGGRKVLEMMFRCSGNLHCFNPEVCKAEDKNVFAQELAMEFRKIKEGNCMETVLSIFRPIVSNKASVDDESSSGYFIPPRAEYNVEKIREVLLRTNLVVMDADLFIELNQAVASLLTEEKKQTI